MFGLELDLDRYMIVAVGDFNMGAMENKGLNIFNTKYVLARPDIATDADFLNIDRVVAHEYFHNWTGNRVTCRDWFQLSLKEGLTVFRDQEFGADMYSRAVTRIQEVRGLRAAQFPEDAGPMAHPVRPQSYMEISQLLHRDGVREGRRGGAHDPHAASAPRAFRRGMDLYFQRHDGQAVTCDDFVAGDGGRERRRPRAVQALVRPGRHAGARRRAATTTRRRSATRSRSSSRCRRRRGSRRSCRCTSRSRSAWSARTGASCRCSSRARRRRPAPTACCRCRQPEERFVFVERAGAAGAVAAARLLGAGDPEASTTPRPSSRT